MRILMVDDEADFLELMNNRLSRRGIEVLCAGSGEEALKVAESDVSFDAVVLDVKMPGLDGIETLRRLKKIRPELPVLLLTGHASLEAAMAGVEIGAVDYLMKPVPLNDLIIRVQEVARGKG